MRWADDFDAIQKRLKEIVEKDNQPKCLVNPDQLLSVCLGSGNKCTRACPNYVESEQAAPAIAASDCYD